MILDNTIEYELFRIYSNVRLTNQFAQNYSTEGGSGKRNITRGNFFGSTPVCGRLPSGGSSSGDDEDFFRRLCCPLFETLFCFPPLVLAVALTRLGEAAGLGSVLDAGLLRSRRVIDVGGTLIVLRDEVGA